MALRYEGLIELFLRLFGRASSLRLAAFLVTAAIAWLTLAPWAPSPQPIGLDQADKVWHFLAFFTWGGLVAVSWSRPFWQLLGAGLCFGGGIELIQPFVGRDAELADLVAATLGAGVGLYAGKSWRSWIRREKKA